MKTIISVVAIVLAAFFVYKLLTFKLFEEDNVKLKVIDVPDRKYKLNLYYIPANATNQSYIQVRQETTAGENVIKSYERYNYLNSFTINEGHLKLILNDTSFVNRKADTVLLKLP